MQFVLTLNSCKSSAASGSSARELIVDGNIKLTSTKCIQLAIEG